VAAPILPESAISSLASVVGGCGPILPILGRMVERNMRSAGVWREGAVEAYFREIGGHLASAARIFKHHEQPDEVRKLARARVRIDETVQMLRKALERGRGAVVAPAHVCNYLLTLARLNMEVPITVYLRWSDDARRLEMKRTWCEAAGLPVILEPASAADPASRAAACVEALRGGAALVMTPDIAQKRGKGVPARLLDREIYLPSGPASIAMLAEAPVVPVFGRLEHDGHVITASEPIFVEPLSRIEGGRKAALARAARKWAEGFEGFLRATPEAWFLWADSRWTRVFSGDAEYCGRIDATTPRTGDTVAPAS